MRSTIQVTKYTCDACGTEQQEEEGEDKYILSKWHKVAIHIHPLKASSSQPIILNQDICDSCINQITKGNYLPPEIPF